MFTKSMPVKIKAVGTADGLQEGQFDALVAVFGNVDSYGDRIIPGAFAEDLKAWAESGNPIPVYWSHQMSDPDMNLGWCLKAEETPDGLQVRVQLDLDNPKSVQVYRLLKGRRVVQFSFAYDVLEAAWITEGNEDVYELRKLHVYEVGPTPIGVNQETELLAVKTIGEHAARMVTGLKAGRVLSAKNETTLRDARDQLAKAVGQIDDVLASVDAGGDEGGKASTAAPAKDDDPAGGKSDEPTRDVSVDLSEMKSIQLAAIAAGI